MKKHVKLLFKHHLAVWANLLLEAQQQDNTAAWLLNNNARTTLFYLEAMTRLLRDIHNPKKMTKLNERFKRIEDALGEMDYYAGLIQAFKGNRKINAAVTTYLEGHLHAATFKTNALLHEQGWVGAKAQRLAQVKKTVGEMDWVSDAQFKTQAQAFYQKHTAKITESLTQEFTEIEAGVHELRRNIRWLSIYPQAFKGFFTLKPARVVAQKWQKYLTPEVVNSPFNQLTRADDIVDVVALNATQFYAMSWLIAALGSLKDQGLNLLALTEALRETQSIPLEQAQAQALKILGAGQANQAEILAAAQTIATQVKKDLLFAGLLPAVKPTS